MVIVARGDEQCEQITAAGIADSFLDRRVVVAALCAPVQSQEVHAAAIVCLLGAQRVHAVRLPQVGGVVGRLPGVVCRDRVEYRAALHDLPKSGAAAVGCAVRPAHARQDGPLGAGDRPAENARAIGSGGWQRLGVASRESLLCETSCELLEILAKDDLRAVSQGRRAVRLREPLDPGDRARAGAGARHQTLPPAARPGPATRVD
jgi:hypothetical protein